MKVQNIIDKAAAITGWNADSRETILLSYIQEQINTGKLDIESFADFVARVVVEEEECGNTIE